MGGVSNLKPPVAGILYAPPSSAHPPPVEGYCVGIPIAWHKARIPVFPRKSIWRGASGLFGPGPERPQNISCSRATQTCTGATLGCSRARDNFGTLRPQPKKTTCSFPYRFFGEIQEFGPCTRQSGSQVLWGVGGA